MKAQLKAQIAQPNHNLAILKNVNNFITEYCDHIYF